MEARIHRYRPIGLAVASLTLLALTVMVLAGCGGSDQQPAGLSGITRDPPISTKNLTLPDRSPVSEGEEVPLKGPEGGLMLVYFGYTFCPDVCPTTMADLRLALAELAPEQRDRIEVAMITVDPARDTAGVLNGYMGHFFEPGEFRSFRTGNAKRLAEVERAFEATHELGKPDDRGYYEVSHTAQVFAINDRGTVEVEWPFQTDAALVADDIRYLLEKNSGTPDGNAGEEKIQ